MLFSLSKSFTSTAIGFAVQEGILSIEESIADIFGDALPSNGLTEQFYRMKLKHLLSMSSGHDKDTMDGVVNQPEGDWVRGFLAQPVEHEPGTHFVYNTGATYMLSAALQRKTGCTLMEFLTPRLFEPLGIEGAMWQTCPRGINTGGFGLSITTEDIVKFGQFYLQKGLWEGQQLLRAEWIDEATCKQIENGAPDQPENDWGQGYGYQFWRCRSDLYRGDGAFGQYCIVMPEQDAVLAINSSLSNMQLPLNHVMEFLLPGIKDECICGEEAAAEEELLAETLAGLKSHESYKASVSHCSFENTTGGKCTINLGENPLKYKQLSMEACAEEDCLLLGIKSDKGEFVLNCGTNSWLHTAIDPFVFMEGGLGTPNSTMDIAAKVYRIGENSMAFSLRFLETPLHCTMEITVDNGNKAHFKTRQNANFSGPIVLEFEGTLV